MKTMILQLVGPMGAWGTSDRYGDTIYDTDKMPSKSSLVGLMASALGRDRFSDISDLAALKMAVRSECGSAAQRFCDYQTALLKKMYPGQKDTTYVTYRYHMSDVNFVVAVRGEDELIETVAEAIQYPHWAPYLGRRADIPALPMFIGIVDDDLMDALSNTGLLGNDGIRYPPAYDVTLPVWRDALDGEASSRGVFVSDMPVSFAPRRRYARRLVIMDKVDVHGIHGPKPADNPFDHDVMGAIEALS